MKRRSGCIACRQSRCLCVSSERSALIAAHWGDACVTWCAAEHVVSCRSRWAVCESRCVAWLRDDPYAALGGARLRMHVDGPWSEDHQRELAALVVRVLRFRNATRKDVSAADEQAARVLALLVAWRGSPPSRQEIVAVAAGAATRDAGGSPRVWGWQLPLWGGARD